MTIEVLHERGLSNRAIARQLGVDEKAVRYRLARLASGRRTARRKPHAGGAVGRGDRPLDGEPDGRA
jgi:IS30 family transposase